MDEKEQELKSTLDEEIDNLSHEDLLEITQSSIRRLITSDPLLDDLPPDVTFEEVVAQIAVAQGQSITVVVNRYSESPLNVVIPQKGTTVLDLKKAIKRTFTLKQQRQRIKTKISWRYVWRTYFLQNIQNGQVLKDNKKEVSAYAFEGEKYPWFDQISRQEQVTEGCDNMGLRDKNQFSENKLDHILVDHNHKLLYCYVPKVACTNWKRVLMVLTGESNTTNPVQISARAAHMENSTLKLSQLDSLEVNSCLKEYTLFLVVRHPFERLLSAYRNKFLDDAPNNKYFKLRYGKYIIEKYRPNPSKADLESGANVTFREFVQYLIKEGVHTNEHWAPIFDLCLPCTLNYTFISHYETITEDSSTILRMVKAPNLLFPVTRSRRTKDNLRLYFQQLSIYEIEMLFKLYEADFKLFGYGLEDMLGYDLA